MLTNLNYFNSVEQMTIAFSNAFEIVLKIEKNNRIYFGAVALILRNFQVALSEINLDDNEAIQFYIL